MIEHVRAESEQAAVRRVATLVARGAPAGELFAAVVAEVGSLFGWPAVGLMRYDSDDSFVVAATCGDHPFPVGSRWPLDGPSTFESVLRTGRPARIADYSDLSGTVAAAARAGGIAGGIGAPIVVNGATWGVIAAPMTSVRSIPDGAEARLSRFTDLVATAIVNAESGEALTELADEHAALRRVAKLVAQEPTPEQVFTAVTEAVGPLLGADLAAMHVFPGDGTATVVAGWTAAGPMIPIGTRLPLEGDSAVARIFQTRAAARIDSYVDVEGGTAEVARDLHLRSTVGAPIVVDGKLWGALMAATRGAEPLPANAETRIAAFTELVATAVSNAQAREELHLLADEQAALRRVATLVAQGARPQELFAVMAEEFANVVEVPRVWLIRYERDGTATVLATANDHAFPAGSRWPLEGSSVTAMVYDTGRPARIDDFAPLPGPIADRTREAGITSAVAVPLIVDGRTWGTVCVATTGVEPLAADTADRLSGFSELFATALANAQARDALARLAEEQTALRRVAELVARESSPAEIFGAVTEEASRVLECEAVGLLRLEPDGSATLLAQSQTPWDPPPLGTRLTLEGENVIAHAVRTGEAARADDWSEATGSVSAMASVLGVRSTVATPIVVEGRLWGLMIAATSQSEPLPADTELRIARFTGLVATAIANTETRVEVARLADEQAALRRVATLVAEGVRPAEVFAAVSHEVERVFGLDRDPSAAATVVRFDADSECVLVGAAQEIPETPLGTRWEPHELWVSTRVLWTGRSARVDESDLDSIGGPEAEKLRRQGYVFQVGSPIVVEGRLWGAMTASASEALPPGTDERLEKFTELVATAIANAESREALERLAEEQAALRRVATLVAQGARPVEVFWAVSDEVGRLFGTELASVGRFDLDGRSIDLVAAGRHTHERVELDDSLAAAAVLRTRRSARAAASVASPIVVEGELWGAMTVASTDESLPPDTEERLEKFTALVATAIANAESRNELAASRRRIVSASDDARRRIERDLHDGVQQRLISLGLDVSAMEAALPTDPELEVHAARIRSGVSAAFDDLVEVARGIHPVILSRGGLGPALRTLARRFAVPVELDVKIDGRLPEDVEVGAYYVVSEALTNVAKHAGAASVHVGASVQDGTIRLSVRDDGVGGADPERGTGLVGLRDRVEALDGRIEVASAPGEGTSLIATIPLAGDSSAGRL